MHCSKGKVSITFDDGPSRANTPRLLRILRKNHAQATFFVQGQNAKRYPALLRAMIRDGHAVENHSWDHPALTTRSDRSVRRQLTLTQKAIRKAIHQSPKLFRPPYGDTSKHVRAIARKRHLTQELWTIDSHDWTGISATNIGKNALRGLRPHRKNVILMHDAVGNSPRTLKAVPGIITGLRKKGYCLVPLQLMMPLDRISTHSIRTDEGAGSTRLVPVTFRLVGPAQRSGSFRLRTVDGTAKHGSDFDRVDRIVPVRRGARSVTIHLRIYGDPMPNAAKAFSVRLSTPRALKLSTTSFGVTITDNQAWDAALTELFTPGPRVAA